MKKIGIVLIIVEVLALLMAFVQGKLGFSGAPIGRGIAELAGFLLPGIIGVVLIARANKKEKQEKVKSLDEQRNQSIMANVYASPQMMEGKTFSTTVSGTYPDIHAVKPQAGSEKEDEYRDTMMEAMYGSPEMMREYANERTGLQNNQTAQDNRDKLCICGKLVPVGEERCPHCGRNMIDPGETGWFCKNCGKWVPMKERVCPYCGNDMFR